MSDPEEPKPDSIVPGEVTQLLAAARGGDAGASTKLFELVYDDLRRLAARHVRGAQRSGPSTTSLVHEAFLRMARRGELPYADRVHFFATASRAMRQIIIDDARSRRAHKRGGGQPEIDLDAVAVAAPAAAAPVEDLLALDDALARLESEEPRLARTVEWHFFGGLTFAEIAEATQVSERTVMRDWRAARAMLHLELAGPG
ncbi:MAG: ECF-type sigma factor [Thermoanaerobaculia bacterium]